MQTLFSKDGAGVSPIQESQIRTFLAQQMRLATVIVPEQYYLDSSFCTSLWNEDSVVALAFHQIIRTSERTIVQIVGTFVAQTGLRRFYVPMLLQRPVVEAHLEEAHLYWACRTRNPRIERALRRFPDVYEFSHDKSTLGALIEACYDSSVKFDSASNSLYGSYLSESTFLETEHKKYSDIPYCENACKFFGGRLNSERCKEYIRALDGSEPWPR